jgi:hypothetical protein
MAADMLQGFVQYERKLPFRGADDRVNGGRRTAQQTRGHRHIAHARPDELITDVDDVS